MNARLFIVAAAVLSLTTGCGTHAREKQATAALAAGTKCATRLNQEFHLHGGSKAISEGFFVDMGNGRLRVTGNVPTSAGLTHAESYKCVLVSDSSGLRIVRFDVKRAE